MKTMKLKNPTVPTLFEWDKLDVLAKYVTAHPACEYPKVTFTREGVLMTRITARQIAHDTLKITHLRGNPKPEQVTAAREYLKAYL